MPNVRRIEKKIFDIEGFEVIIKQGGRDVRSDYVLPKQYEAERMTRNAFSVKDFREKFQRQFPGFELDVLTGDGTKARGQTKLATVRDTYLND